MNAQASPVLSPLRLTLTTLTLLSGAAMADTSKGAALFKAGQYAQALTELTGPAHSGDRAAQSYLGQMYENGYGVKRDYVQAASWYQKAATAGSTDGMNDLGQLYGYGQGVPYDQWSGQFQAALTPRSSGLEG